MIEFAFLMPILMAMLVLLVEAESAISTAIVNLRYSRQHLHFLTFNHRHYMEHGFMTLKSTGQFMQREWAGISDRSTFSDENPIPRAPQRKIGSVKPAEDNQAGDVSQRQNVRIRSIAFMCIPPIGPARGVFFSEGGLREDTFLGGRYFFCEK
jgi:hypothetical protein